MRKLSLVRVLHDKLGVHRENAKGLVKCGHLLLDGEPIAAGVKELDWPAVQGSFLGIRGTPRTVRLGSALAGEHPSEPKEILPT